MDDMNPPSLARIEKTRAATRARVWTLASGGLPAGRVAGHDLPQGLVVLDVEATIRVWCDVREGTSAN